MDSITHALYKAIAAEDAHQRKVEAGGSARAGDLVTAGLQPIEKRHWVQDTYANSLDTDLHIQLSRSPELLALQMEFIAMGYCPPAGLYERGADVVISPGSVEVFCSTDGRKPRLWTATLQKQRQHAGQAARAGWEEMVR